MYEEESAKSAYPTERASSRLPLSSQEKTLVELHDTIGQLTERLKPILTPAEPTDRPLVEDKASPIQSPLADQLEANNSGIRKASNKLHALIERIEC